MDDQTNLLHFFRPEGIAPALLVLAGAWVGAGLVSRLFARLGERFVGQRLVLQQSKAILRLVVFAAGVSAAASLIFRFSDEAIFTLGGTLAVTFGFAFKDLLASMIAGVIILADRPFQVGDRISFGGYYGEVSHIGLRAVRLVTLDDNLVTIPNNKFLTDPVASGNSGALDMLIQMDFYIGLDQDLAAARQLVGEALTSCRYSFLDKPWIVLVNQVTIGDLLAMRLRAKVYVLDVKYEKHLETDVNEQVMAAFAHNAIQPPALLHRKLA